MKTSICLFVFVLYLGLSLDLCSKESDASIAFVPQKQLEAMIHDRIAKAKHRIYIAHYIIYNEKPGRRILSHLIKRAEDGLDVRVLFDGMGPDAKFPYPKSSLHVLVNAGIKLGVFHPKGKFWYKIHKRLHVKIMLFDDEALLGSSSLWWLSFEGLVWETDFLLKGRVVEEVKKHFLHLFASREVVCVDEKIVVDVLNLKNGRKNFLDEALYDELEWISILDFKYLKDLAKRKKRSGLFFQVLEEIEKAKFSVDIVNPYFFPVRKLRKVLIKLRKRGVRVTVYTNRSKILSDEYSIVGLKYQQSFSFFRRSKISLYELSFHDFMVHNKFIVIDKSRSFIGSLNLDPLSSYYNVENGIFINEGHIKDLERRKVVSYLLGEIHKMRLFSRLAFKDGEQLIKKGNGRKFLTNLGSYLILPFLGRYL